MTPHSFIQKWKAAALTERQSAQEHFLDLCRLFGHPTPAEDDPKGERYAFEKGATKTGGGEGFADVWKHGHFAWEYKKKKRNLDEALAQLVRYAAALENPPLQVVCDIDRFRIVTAWTNTVPKTHELTLGDLADPEKRAILHAVFHNPERLRPQRTRAAVTREAADKFSTIALRLQGHGSPEDVAHFVNQLVFCFFASSVRLLPEGFFPKLLQRAAQRPERAKDNFDKLFAAMEKGGEFDLTDIAWFNGGLFDGRRALPLDHSDIGLLVAAASLDWSQIDPSIFGTLFERFLDPDKRAQIGAHYTDPDKIMMIVEPVILRPLLREWDEAKAEIQGLLTGQVKPPMQAAKPGRKAQRMSPRDAAQERRSVFLERLRTLSILDPACGSGNFLYLALQAVKDIELRANLECEALGLGPRAPMVGPEILHGIEINPLAAELARTTIWIGDIQWAIRNGIYARGEPVLRKLDAIECRDALVGPVHPSSCPASGRASTSRQGGVDGRDKPGHDGEANASPEAVPVRDAFVEASWPNAEFIVGNPPFLGGKLMRRSLGDEAVDTLFQVYEGRVPPEADLVTYWFEKARAQIAAGLTKRAGLVSTNSIRGGANRRVLERVAADAPVFEAWSDEPWIVEGAAVRVSLLCFGQAGDSERKLDGAPALAINCDLTSGSYDLTKARRLPENLGVAFMGDTKGGPFDVPGDLARAWLKAPLNPNGRPNSDVLRPWVNGLDVSRRPRDMWIIDFGWKMSESEAALFEEPFAYALEHIRPERVQNRREAYARYWWRHVEPRPKFRGKISFLRRYAATPRVARHRFFLWLPTNVTPDSRIFGFSREDDCFFGLLQSRFHEGWALSTCSWHGVGNDPTYNSEGCFETFPFPEGLTPNRPASAYADDPRAKRIADAAKRLDELRQRWLNPPDLVRIEPEVAPGYPDRILPKNAEAAIKLKERTLTNLYNQRPAWLDNAHAELDRAVAAAYGWPEDIATEDALARLLALNLERAGRDKTAA